jgi:hypothetical protein
MSRRKRSTMATKREQRILLVKMATGNGKIDGGELEALLADGWSIAQMQALPLNATQHHLVLLLEREPREPRAERE